MRQLNILLRDVEAKDKFYTQKVKLLCQLIYNPQSEYVIGKELVLWCIEAGLKLKPTVKSGNVYWACKTNLN